MLWALDPLNNPSAPASPFEMKEYIVPEMADFLKYTKEANKANSETHRADDIGNDYMQVSLVITMVMFFCGLSGTTDSYTSQKILIGIGVLIFSAALFFVFRLPVIW